MSIPAAQGSIDPELALQLVNEYFDKASDEELYDDLKEVAPELIEYFEIPDPRASQ